ncbi:MAG: ABC transporter permease [Caldilineaceae bacterium]
MLKTESLGASSDTPTAAQRGSLPAGLRVLQRLARDRVGMAGLLIVLVITLLSVFAPLLAPYDPLVIQKGEQFLPPSTAHLFGTDEFGRDIFSRTLYAGRISLLAGLFAVAVATLIGVPLGLVAGYVGRLTDTIIMRTMDSLLAFPAVLLALAVVAVLGPSSFNAMIAVAIVSIPNFARIARAAMLTQKGTDYVEAARSIGANDLRIVFRTILPNSLAPILVQITLAVAFAILIEAALSFLGLGTQPPDASWGAMLLSGRSHLRRAWWYGFFPGLFITLLVLGLNHLAEALRDALDPTHQGR